MGYTTSDASATEMETTFKKRNLHLYVVNDLASERKINPLKAEN